ALNQPTDIAVDSEGNLYIAESASARIRKVTTDGVIKSVAIPQLQTIAGMALDNAGNLYFSERTANRVRKVSPDGKVTTVVGTGIPGSGGDGGPATSAQLTSPRGLAVDNAGSLYIADTGNHRVRKVEADGTILLVAGNGSKGLSGDGGVAVLAQINSPAGL